MGSCGYMLIFTVEPSDSEKVLRFQESAVEFQVYVSIRACVEDDWPQYDFTMFVHKDNSGGRPSVSHGGHGQ